MAVHSPEVVVADFHGVAMFTGEGIVPGDLCLRYPGRNGYIKLPPGIGLTQAANPPTRPVAFAVGTPVIFGRSRGEKTQGTIVGTTRGGKYKIRQDEVRGTHPVGCIWTVPASLLQVDTTRASGNRRTAA